MPKTQRKNFGSPCCLNKVTYSGRCLEAVEAAQDRHPLKRPHDLSKCCNGLSGCDGNLEGLGGMKSSASCEVKRTESNVHFPVVNIIVKLWSRACRMCGIRAFKLLIPLLACRNWRSSRRQVPDFSTACLWLSFG